MQKLIYEDVNLKTHFAYEIRSFGYSSSKLKYFVYECDPDGHKSFIGEYNSYDEAKALVKEKCN